MASLRRKDDRIILHFDYDCFYAACVENSNPAFKGLPLAIQQKQIIVTANYPARQRGLHKLQLIRDARRICPDVVIVSGEDLTKFRDYSKALYRHLRHASWNGRVEQLGFDEVWMDVTDIVDYNVDLLNDADLSRSFFCLRPDEPTVGFSYDASTLKGHAHDRAKEFSSQRDTHNDPLLLRRLILGSHLAHHLRLRLEEQHGFTSAVGIGPSKILSKLVGNVNKPNAQTTLLPPYASTSHDVPGNVALFLDAHDVSKVPGFGFKTSTKLREFWRVNAISQKAEESDSVTVGDVRALPGLDAKVLEDVLGGPGMPRGIGHRTLLLLHGIDDSEVAQAKDVPKQISIEDSYLRLDTFSDVHRELLLLSKSLIRRMRIDLTEGSSDTEYSATDAASKSRRWVAHPKTLRLSTRPRPPPDADGTRGRASNRISRSMPLPAFVFNLSISIDALAERLVSENLSTMFRQLHPDDKWDLSLVNVAVTNIAETAGDSKSASGRDISRMFRTQERVLQPWKLKDIDMPPDEETETNDADGEPMEQDITPAPASPKLILNGSEDKMPLSQSSQATSVPAEWIENDDEEQAFASACPLCGAVMPEFALAAHLRYHEIDD